MPHSNQIDKILRLRSSSHWRLIAFLIFVFFSAICPLSLYIGIIIITEDPGGFLNLFIIPCINIFIALILGVAWILPVTFISSRVATLQSIRISTSTRIKVLVASGTLVFFLYVSLSAMLFLLSRSPQQPPDNIVMIIFGILFLGGIPLIVGLPLYYLTTSLWSPEISRDNLQLSDRDVT